MTYNLNYLGEIFRQMEKSHFLEKSNNFLQYFESFFQSRGKNGNESIKKITTVIINFDFFF